LGSKTPEEKAIEEKINNYQQIVDTAYILFDGKYSIEQLNSISYKNLIKMIEHEHAISDEFKEIKAARKLNNL